MTDKTDTKKSVKKEEKRFSLFGFLLSGFFQIITWLILGYGLFILIALLLTFFHGAEALDGLLAGQLDYLKRAANIFFDPYKIAIQTAHFVYLWVFVKTRIVVLFHNHNALNTGYFLLDNTARHLTPSISKYGYALMTAIEILAVKTVTLLFVLPLFILMFFAGLVDGLTQRDLRRFGGGRENATVHKIARSYVIPTLGGGFFVYLIMPLNILPEIIFITFACLFGFSILITAKSWKKHGWFN